MNSAKRIKKTKVKKSFLSDKMLNSCLGTIIYIYEKIYI